MNNLELSKYLATEFLGWIDLGEISPNIQSTTIKKQAYSDPNVERSIIVDFDPINNANDTHKLLRELEKRDFYIDKVYEFTIIDPKCKYYEPDDDILIFKNGNSLGKTICLSIMELIQ